MNRIKESGSDGLALQVTKAARRAGMVEEDNDGEATWLADVRVFAFDGVMLVVDLDRVETDEIAELVTSAASGTDSVHRAMDSKIQIAGNGYQVQLPPAADAGFELGDRGGTHPAPGLLVIAKGDGPRAGQASQLAKDLVEQRRSRVST